MAVRTPGLAVCGPETATAASTVAQPAWANPGTALGTLIATIALGDITIEVFQVGTTQAPSVGGYSDPVIREALIRVGDRLVLISNASSACAPARLRVVADGRGVCGGQCHAQWREAIWSPFPRQPESCPLQDTQWWVSA